MDKVTLVDKTFLVAVMDAAAVVVVKLAQVVDIRQVMDRLGKVQPMQEAAVAALETVVECMAAQAVADMARSVTVAQVKAVLLTLAVEAEAAAVVMAAIVLVVQVLLELNISINRK